MAEKVDQALRERAIIQLADSKYHRALWLSPKTQAGRPSKLRVSYADVNYRRVDGTEMSPVVLFCGGMFCMRYVLAVLDEHAKANGLRILCADRPGMGGSETVPLEHRIETWLDTVRALLKELNVDHVAVVAHSAGTIYAMNIALHARDLLHPEHPTIVFFAPWVHPSHSKITMLRLASLLPGRVLDSWPSVAMAVNQNVVPALGFSKGALQTSWSSMNPYIDSSADRDHDENLEYLQALRLVAAEYAAVESLEGGAHEAKMCLRVETSSKDSDVELWAWGGWEEYDALIQVLMSRESSKEEAGKFHVRAFYAANDALIGTKGSKWFDHCWNQETCKDRVVFSSQVVAGTDHDSVIGAENAIVAGLFKSIA